MDQGFTLAHLCFFVIFTNKQGPPFLNLVLLIHPLSREKLRVSLTNDLGETRAQTSRQPVISEWYHYLVALCTQGGLDDVIKDLEALPGIPADAEAAAYERRRRYAAYNVLLLCIKMELKKAAVVLLGNAVPFPS